MKEEKNIPLAPRVPASTVELRPEPTAPPKPTTHWNVRDDHKGHKDSKETVLKEIEADTRIPDHWRTALLVEIQKRDCKAMEVHVHAQDVGNGFVLSVHLKTLF